MGSYQDVEMQPPSGIYCLVQTEWKYANAAEHLYALIIIWVTAFRNEANISAKNALQPKLCESKRVCLEGLEERNAPREWLREISR